MRHTILIFVLALTGTLAAQGQSGRTFRRATRMPETRVESPVQEASQSRRVVRPLKKLRSGRPWPKWHYSRLPRPVRAVSPSSKAVDASSTKVKKRGKRRFWGPRR